MDELSPVITIDGPSGAGKGTLSKALAKQLNWHYLDSGALYRIVTWMISSGKQAYSMESLESIDKGRLVKILDDIKAMCLDFGSDTRIDKLGRIAERIGPLIRTERVGVLTSKLAALGEVRSLLLDFQSSFLQPPGLVADGRDMGTVVFPAARVKIFLQASATERAKRRHKELIEKGENVILSELIKDIEQRDGQDTRRQYSPLVAASDAIILDSTGMTAEEVYTKIMCIVETAL